MLGQVLDRMYLHYIVHAFTCTSMHAHASVVKYIGVAYENSRRLACRLEGAKFSSHSVHGGTHVAATIIRLDLR